MFHQSWRRFFPFLMPVVFALANAAAADWPEGYVVYRESRSPDGHYGIVLPGHDRGTADDSDTTNYFADLTTQQLLGEIDGADYFEGQNHRGLKVAWAPDSKWCVATYDGRYGFDFISILEPKGSQFTQTDLGEHIGKALNAVIAKQAHDPEAAGYCNAYFRTRPDRKLLVRAQAHTNPKQLENVPSFYAAFEGTFDLDSRKWTASRARRISSDEFDDVSNGYSDYTGKNFIVIKDPAREKVPEDFVGTILSSDEEKAEYIERTLNEVYRAVRAALPAERFAEIKRDQRAWLKKRDAISSFDEKCKFTDARIRSLQDLLW